MTVIMLLTLLHTEDHYHKAANPHSHNTTNGRIKGAIGSIKGSLLRGGVAGGSKEPRRAASPETPDMFGCRRGPAAQGSEGFKSESRGAWVD